MERLKGTELENVANAISRYISSRPNASETVEGVARWWLLRQRYEDSLEVVQDALNYLEAEGKVARLKIPGGKEVYRSLGRGKRKAAH